MTAKKGMLWKTPWNRARGAPPPEAVQMEFFRSFFQPGPNNALYATTPNPSSLGLTLPFWFGIVGFRYSGTSGPFNNPQAFSVVTPRSSDGLVGVAGLLGLNFFDLDLAVPGDDNIVAALISVAAFETTYRYRITIDDQMSQIFTSPIPFTPANDDLVIAPGALPGCVHGLCGGPGTITPEQSKQWFADLKANLEIQAIPGQTTHLYSAASVLGVPVLLPNLGSAGAAQDMNLIVTAGAPVPQHVTLPVLFPY